MTDPWLSAAQRHDSQWVELDAQLQAVVEAAVAETLAKLWRMVLGERVSVTAAAQPPALAGAEQAARETWTQALNRWVRPVAYAHYTRQYDAEGTKAPVRARDSWWALTLERLANVADSIVAAVRTTVIDHPTESIDQLRDRVAQTLALDAPAAAIRAQIADVENQLAQFATLSAAQRSGLLERRVRLQAELFRFQASASRSKAYAALAQALPEDADQFRDLARSAARGDGDLARIEKELAAVDDQLYRSKRPATAEAAAEEADLHARRRELTTVTQDEETWRNKATRIARTESTNVLNEATLQRGLDAEQASGQRMVKVWLSADDTRVRATHGRNGGAHGQTVGLREKFEVGEAFLDRPGDPEGPLAEVVQCRCGIAVLTETEHREIASVLASADADREPTRVVFVGGPRCGKSTAARALREQGVPTYCTDPLSLVKDPEEGVTYLPEGMNWSEASQWVADNWILGLPGPFCIEGIATVRALRKIAAAGKQDQVDAGVILFGTQFADAVTKRGQQSMAKAIATVWNEIEPIYRHKTIRYDYTTGGGWGAPTYAEARGITAAIPQEEPVSVATTERPAAPPDLESLPPLQWYGVIAVEDVYTGDRRKFTSGSLRIQPLPMPMRFQREDWGGHTGAVVVANMEGARRFGNQIRAWGTFADGSLTREVDEVQGLMATRMMRGISIDGDDVLDSQFTFETDSAGNLFEVYQSARLRSATMVAVPAYDEAEVFLGPPPAEWLLEGEALAEEQNDPDTFAYVPEDLDMLVADVAGPQNTPEYWLPGGVGGDAIAWGTDGDFPRCRQQLSAYVTEGQASAVCANLSYQALGVWPGQQPAPVLIASAGERPYDAADFAQRELTEPTPLTITDDGEVFGHLALWSSCHTGYSDMCVTPPKSRTQYAMFHTGAVRLSDGSDLRIGKLTVGAGHANPRSGLRAAASHYDNSASAAAVVRAFEDPIGIQVVGRIILGTSDEKIDELRRSPLSGDWRAYQGSLELVAALGVNTPGFPVLPLVASVEGRQISLVAAGHIPVDIAERVRELTASLGLDPISQAAVLAATLPAATVGELQASAALLAAGIPREEEA